MCFPLRGEEFKATGALSNGSRLVCSCETWQPPPRTPLLAHGRAQAGRERRACRNALNLICQQQRLPSDQLRWAFRQRNAARVIRKPCGNLRFFAFSVTDVYSSRDRSCCPYVDVTHGKGRLGNNWPRATLPEFVQISLVCNAGP